MERKQLYISISHEERRPLLESHVLATLGDFAASENVSIYLVGGSVRDILLGRETEDLDFAVTGAALDFAGKFADSANARSIRARSSLKQHSNPIWHPVGERYDF